MESNDLTQEYKTFLKGLEEINLNTFLNGFKEIENYKLREEYLNKYYNENIFNILIKEDFLKLFYLDNQAKFILKELSLKDLDIFETLVYCYNHNSREFNKRIKEYNLKKELLNKGFKEIEFLIYKEKETEQDFNKRLEETYKPLNDLKVLCVFDRDKIGLLGSFTNKEEHEGKLFYDETRRVLFFIPKRHTKTGQILRSNFYYKEI